MSDTTSGADCKKIEATIKAIRARIRRLAKTAPGPARQVDRIGIAGDLILIASRLQEAAVGILLEPEEKNGAGPSESKKHHGLHRAF